MVERILRPVLTAVRSDVNDWMRFRPPRRWHGSELQGPYAITARLEEAMQYGLHHYD
jgi:hypothetical protein